MSLKIRHVGIEGTEETDLRQELRMDGIVGGAEGFQRARELLFVGEASEVVGAFLKKQDKHARGAERRLVVVDVLDVADDLDVMLDDPVARVPCGHVVFKRVKVTLPVRLARAGQAAERR